MKNGYPTGSWDFTTRELEILHLSASRCIDIYTAMNLSLVYTLFILEFVE